MEIHDLVPFVTTPEDHGAIGDGQTDDTPAIQSAINSGCKVLFGPNTYRVCSTITITKPTHLIGCGIGSTIIDVVICDCCCKCRSAKCKQEKTDIGSGEADADNSVNISPETGVCQCNCMCKCCSANECACDCGDCKCDCECSDCNCGDELIFTKLFDIQTDDFAVNSLTVQGTSDT